MSSRDGKNYPWTGSTQILEEKGIAKDLNGQELNLYRGTYEMMSCRSNVMIRKGLDITLESYDLLRDFQHDNAIRLLDYYTDGAKKGCLVIPEVSTTFEIWFENGGNKLLFDSSRHMTVFFKEMIIGLCSVVYKLTKKNLIIENFGIEDLYFSSGSQDFENFGIEDLYFSLGSQDLCVLLTKVKKEKMMLDSVAKSTNWNHIKDFISWCEKRCNVEKDNLTESFYEYIGQSHFNVEYLEGYPDDWDHAKKGDYLMALVASNHNDMRTIWKNAEFDWPFQNTSRISGNLPSLIQKILDWEEKENDRQYDFDRMGYIFLLRNLYKHYGKLPPEIKTILISRKALIEMIENWTPGIWINIYERVGWPKVASK